VLSFGVLTHNPVVASQVSIVQSTLSLHDFAEYVQIGLLFSSKVQSETKQFFVGQLHG